MHGVGIVLGIVGRLALDRPPEPDDYLCLSQTAGVMMGAPSPSASGERLLAAVNRLKFLRPVSPGSELRIETRKIAEAGPLVYVEATVEVAGEVVARGELSVYSA